MRHRIQTKRLGRSSSLRKATIISLARALILEQSIKTTYAKARAAVPLVERLISLAKKDTLNARRAAYRVLGEHKLVVKLFSEVKDLFKARDSGFTRIFKMERRRGDDAQMCLFELTEKAEKEKKVKKEKASPGSKETPPEQGAQAQAAHPGAGEEKTSAEEKQHMVKEDKTKQVVEKKKEPGKKFLGGLRSFFKKERDSL